MPWREGLRAFRAQCETAMEESTPNPWMFVLCSENASGAALAASFRPAIVLQLLAGLESPSDTATRATVEYAVRAAGVRTVVFFGHDGCHGARGDMSHAATQSHVVEQCRALYDDAILGPLLRKYRVKAVPMWLHEKEGDVYRCDIEGARTYLMDDEELSKLFTRSGEAVT